MSERAFVQVDVFSAEPFRGNPLAVVLDADGLHDDELQRFATWTNLSETTFLLPPTDPAADYRVRIFTPAGELPFAGHPTIGSAHAWLEAGGQPARDGVIVQECGVGLVTLRRDGARLAFDAPPLTRYEALDAATTASVAAALGVSAGDIVDASWLVNGPDWIGVRLVSADAVLSVRPDAVAMSGLKVGIVGAQKPGSETQFEVRAFVGDGAIGEDPVTGSLNAGLARWLIDTGVAPSSYIAAQGTALGRAGRVYVRAEGSSLWIGGDATTCIRGSVSL